jgi:DNA-binding LytR/AlgR family response regulator
MKNSFFVKSKGSVVRILCKEVIFIEAAGDYVKIHCKSGVYSEVITVHCTLALIEAQTKDLGFVRIHRSFVVFLDNITSIEDGGLYIDKVPVAIGGGDYREELMKHITILGNKKEASV